MRLLFSFNFKSTLKIQERQGGKVDFLARGSHSSAVTSLQPKKAAFCRTGTKQGPLPQQQPFDSVWSGKRDSNSRPPPWQGDALPLSYFRKWITCIVYYSFGFMSRERSILRAARRTALRYRAGQPESIDSAFPYFLSPQYRSSSPRSLISGIFSTHSFHTNPSPAIRSNRVFMGCQ